MTGSRATSFTLAYDTSRGGGAFGPSICVDPGFDYYKQHPLGAIANAIRRRGFTAVQIVRLGRVDGQSERAFADAFRAAGVAPVLRIYPPTDNDLYAQHPEWHQRMLDGSDGVHDWRKYCCPNRPEFVAEHCRRVEEHMRNGAYDGIQLAEIWFEQWGGPADERGNVREHYACACDACVAKFKTLTGVDPRPMLTDKSSSFYFQKPENKALYEKWVTFRVDTIQAYGAALIAAARRVNPKAAVNVMFLSDATVEPGGTRTYQANDLERMVGEWKPEILTLQDAWQDWLKPNLSPQFVSVYAAAYRDRIRKANPSTFVMSHADIGSLPASKRSFDWIQQFAAATVQCGLGAPSAYEWSVSTMAADVK